MYLNSENLLSWKTWTSCSTSIFKSMNWKQEHIHSPAKSFLWHHLLHRASYKECHRELSTDFFIKKGSDGHQFIKITFNEKTKKNQGDIIQLQREPSITIVTLYQYYLELHSVQLNHSKPACLSFTLMKVHSFKTQIGQKWVEKYCCQVKE